MPRRACEVELARPVGDMTCDGRGHILYLSQGTSMTSYKCPKCGGLLEASNSQVGQSDTCPTCGNVCTVPAPSAVVAPPSPRRKATFLSSSADKGAVVGLLLGYPLSYFCQPSAVRTVFSLGDYVIGVRDVLTTRALVVTAILAWIGAVVVFAILGAALGGRRSGNS